MSLDITRMNVSDMEAVSALWRETEGIGDVPSAGAFSAFLARNGGFCRVAKEDGVVVGALLASFDGMRGYFYRLAVSRAFRRRGIAAGMVAEATRALREAGADRINLHVFDSNGSAKAFWERQGYRTYEGLSMLTRR